MPRSSWVDTFGDVTERADRTTSSHAEGIRDVIEQGVTVLSSDDPVRVYERFATLDAISNGRSEVVLGCGSFTESFPLFGFKLSEHDTLFSEKLELFSRLRAEVSVTWSGELYGHVVAPRVRDLLAQNE